MKRTLLVLTAILGTAGLCGCACTHGTGPVGLIRGSCAKAPELCASCDDCGCDGCGESGTMMASYANQPECNSCTGGLRHLLRKCCCFGHGCDDGGVPEVTQPGPPVGQVAYPYYTTRGPRDFLMASPRPLGP
jgi:hypothetical protein